MLESQSQRKPWRRKALGFIAAAVTGLAMLLPSAPAAQAGVNWKLKSKQNGRCLTSWSEGLVFAFRCYDDEDQIWIERANDRRSNVATGFCLVGDNPIRTFTCGGWPDQRWFHEPLGNGLFRIKSRATGTCLDTAKEPNTVVGDYDVYLSPCNNSDDLGLKWEVVPA